MKKVTPQTATYSTTMYTVVFGSVWVKCAVLLVFAFLLLQPVAMVHAEESEDTLAPTQAEEASVQADASDFKENVVEENQELEIEEVMLEEEVTLAESSSEETTQSEPLLPLAEETATSSDPEEQSPLTEPTATTSEEVILEEPVIDEQQEVVPEPSGEEESPVSETPVETPEVSEGESEDLPPQEESDEINVATSTNETASSTGESVLIVEHNTSQLKFTPDECASVGDGAFYCSTPKDLEEFEEDGVFAAPDADGDMEIFIRLNGEENQLTSNIVDDNAPYYDSLSERIVWHTQHNDRYQIVSYDLESGEETRLTDTNYNNMEPVAYGEITMYQAWIDNNWEIMLHDGTSERRLTTNAQHDVSPNMHGGYIVWQSQFADGWQVAVYDQEADHIEYVRSEGGAKVENPRFVLVYDSTNDAGDVQTLGYDFNNKRSFTLNSIPADLPDELPEPDQTGETRALIQNKQTIRDTEIEEGEPTPTDTPNATSTASHGIRDIDLTSSSTPQAATSSPSATLIEDIVIPALDSATTTQEIDQIEDVVIPPLSSTSTIEIR